MRMIFRRRVIGAALLAIALVAAACGSGDDVGSGSTIVVGSTNFSEQEILAEIYSQALAADGFNIEKKFQLGTRDVVEPALEAGEIDFYVEYAATVLEYLNNGAGEASGNIEATWDRLVERFADRGVTVLDYAPAIDTNAFVVRPDTAAQYGLTRVSDLQPVAASLILGGPPECPNRPFCIPGLASVYGISFGEFKPLDTGGPITVAALEGGEIDVALLFSSDGAIAAKGFVVLADDKELQGADNIVPVVRTGVVDEFGDSFVDLINEVSESITTSELSEMNRRVNIDKDDPEAVARDWLIENGFIDA